MRSWYLFSISLWVYYGAASDGLLEFTTPSDATQEDNIYLDDGNPTVILYAASTSSPSVYFLGTNKLTEHVVTLECQTTERSMPLAHIQICCRSDVVGMAECHDIVSMSPKGSITCNYMEFDYIADPKSGATFTLSFNPVNSHNFPYNGLISCSLSDNTATVNSVEIILRDASFYANQLAISPSNVVERYTIPISPYSFPLPFKCGDYKELMKPWPVWMKSVWPVLSPYGWGYCAAGKSNTPLSCAYSATAVNAGDGISTMDGTLYVLKEHLLRTHPNSAFVCFLKRSRAPIITYAYSATTDETPKIVKGFSIDDNAITLYPNELIPLSELSTEFVFVEGTTLNNFYLRAFYRKPVNRTVNFAWYKNGEHQVGDQAQEYSLRLNNYVDRRIAGRYELRLSSSSKEKIFTFDVRVVGPPRFTDPKCVSELLYVMEGSVAKFVCNIYGERTEIRVGVNGLESTTPSGLKKRLLAVIDPVGKPISQIDVDFSTSNDGASGKLIDLIVKNLLPNQDFRISIKALNEYGEAQVTGIIRVIPKPVLSISPSSVSCTQDCDEEPFEVQCILDNSTVSKWHEYFGILYMQSWLIERTWTIESLQKDHILSGFFKFNSSYPTVLEISPSRHFDKESTSNATLQSSLEMKTSRQIKALTVECRIRLFVNNSRAHFERAKSSSDEIVGKQLAATEEKNLIYDSYLEEDSKFAQSYMAKRRLGPIEYQPALAGFSWILAIVISVIIVLCVIVLGIWLCTRDRGESYNAYRKELKIGKDPLLELKDNSTFQPFERPEGPPLPATRSSLSGESVNFGSDEEGELDEYNLDPGHFNEEASYIGQYGRTPQVSMTTYPKNYPPQSDHHTAV